MQTEVLAIEGVLLFFVLYNFVGLLSVWVSNI